LNAFDPIFVTDFGIVILVKYGQFKNAFALISITLYIISEGSGFVT
jgi:hypothetical protein